MSIDLSIFSARPCGKSRFEPFLFLKIPSALSNQIVHFHDLADRKFLKRFIAA